MNETMFWRWFCVLVAITMCVYCENVWNDGEIENHQMMLEESRTLNGHYRHSLRNYTETLQQNIHILPGDEASNTESSISFGAVDRKYVRRTNFRRRKMGSSYNNKKNIFRRGQRHRQNKNGNSFVSRQQINFFFSSFAYYYTIKAITNRFNLREMSFCPTLIFVTATVQLIWMLCVRFSYGKKMNSST